MNTISTIKTWEHNALLEAHELMENSLRLVRDNLAWAIAILLALMVAGFILSPEVPKSLNLNMPPMYPWPAA